MKRIVEPELMEGEAQSLAYAQADFEQPHSYFIQLLKEKLGSNLQGNVLDLGCGTGDITLRFANAYPDCLIEGVDGSQSMLYYAYRDLEKCEESVKTRVNLIQGILPETSLNLTYYDVIISNSLLHHLHNPLILWQTIRKYSQVGTKIFIMDLLRPSTIDEVKLLVQNYAQNEPEILQRDFFNSLCASFTLEEIQQQLITANLAYLKVEKISDRHVIINGEIK